MNAPCLQGETNTQLLFCSPRTKPSRLSEARVSLWSRDSEINKWPWPIALFSSRRAFLITNHIVQFTRVPNQSHRSVHRHSRPPDQWRRSMSLTNHVVRVYWPITLFSVTSVRLLTNQIIQSNERYWQVISFSARAVSYTHLRAHETA